MSRFFNFYIDDLDENERKKWKFFENDELIISFY